MQRSKEELLDEIRVLSRQAREADGCLQALARANQALYKSEERFYKFFEFSPDIIAVSVLADGTFLRVNERFVQTTGYSRGEAVGQTALSLGLWADAGDRLLFIEKAREKGGCSRFRTRMHTRRGTILHVTLSGSVIDFDGRECLLAFIRDVTALHAAEERRARETRIIAAVSEISSGILSGGASLEHLARLTLDAALVLTDSAAGSVVYRGYDGACTTLSRSLPGDAVVDSSLCLSEDPCGFLTPDRMRLLSEAPSSVPNVDRFFPGRPLRRVLAVPAEVDGELVGHVSVADAEHPYTADEVDVLLRLSRAFSLACQHFKATAALLGARDQAESAKRGLNEFLANMGHEVRTPMNGIVTMAEMLQSQAETPEQRDGLETIQFSAATLMKLLNSILDYSRIEAGHVRLVSEPFALESMVRAVVDGLASAAEAKGLALGLEFGPGVPDMVFGDGERIQQVLSCLADNAVKFTAEGRVAVRLEADVNGNRATLRMIVADTGPGISREDRERVFREFVQADGSTTRPHGGAGLGLAIVRRLTEMMGGTVRLCSEPGNGSTFTVSLPVTVDRPVPVQAAAPSPAASAGGRLGALRILLVEDQAVNIVLTLRILERWGHKADVAEGGEEALRRLEAADYDLVLLDIRLPDISGVEVLRALRGGARNRDVPTYSITAYASPEERRAYIDAGFTGNLVKPVNPQALREVLRGLGG